METPETGGDSDDGAIRDGLVLARYLNISINAPKSVKSGDLFDVRISISLSKDYSEHAQQLLEYVRYHHNEFFSFIDIGLKNLSNGQIPKESRNPLLFHQHPEIFNPNKPYVFIQPDWRTVFPGRYLVIARVRRKTDYNDFDYTLQDLKDPQKKFLETGIVASPLEVVADSKVIEPKKPGVIPVGLNSASKINPVRMPDGTFRI